MTMGRPRKEINQDEFEKLCGIMCTLVDIAGWFNCSEDTIERWCKRTYETTFAEAFKKHCSPGKISLRRKQFEIALNGNGNVGMLIWLGKQYLGQTEKVLHAEDPNIRQSPDLSLLTEDEKSKLVLLVKTDAV